MKVTVNQKTEKKFEPIELVLTIETAEELCDLWHRFDVQDVRRPFKVNECLVKTKSINHNEVYKQLDNLIIERNLKS